MKNKVYSIYDTKGNCFAPPFLAQTDELAKRQVFISLKGAGDIPPNVFPADFVLFCLTTFDSCDAFPDKNPSPVNLGTLLQLNTQINQVHEKTS